MVVVAVKDLHLTITIEVRPRRRPLPVVSLMTCISQLVTGVLHPHKRLTAKELGQEHVLIAVGVEVIGREGAPTSAMVWTTKEPARGCRGSRTTRAPRAVEALKARDHHVVIGRHEVRIAVTVEVNWVNLVVPAGRIGMAIS